MASRPKSHRERFHGEKAEVFNGSSTSYEDIPEGEARVNILSSSNRQSVMQALQNLQEKIHRLELDRSHAQGDMECLANETARFRRMLSVPGEEAMPSMAKENNTARSLHPKRPPNCYGFRSQIPMSNFSNATLSAISTSRLQPSGGHPDVIQPSIDFHNCGDETRLRQEACDGGSDSEDNKTINNCGSATMPFLYGSHRDTSPPLPSQDPTMDSGTASDRQKPPCLDSSSVPSSSYNLPPQTPQAVAIALTSAETRCSILEQQLAYMRTLLEAAERDRNEAQRRSRHRGAEFQAWRRSVEAQLERLETELREERGRNRVLCEKASSPLPAASPDPAEGSGCGASRESDSEPERRSGAFEMDLMSSACRREALPLKPSHAWREVAAPKAPPRSRFATRVSPSRGRRPARSGGGGGGGTIPFVAGKSTTPSHNVGLNLQAVMQIANRKAATAAVGGSRCGSGGGSVTGAGSAAARRRQQADQVDRQLGQDVQVVLEELVDEYDALCRVHGRCVHQLAAATDERVKEQLQHQLSDLVNRMEVKGQQIGRLRGYLGSIDAAAAAAIAFPSAVVPADMADNDSERRARSIRFLNKARQMQSLGMHSDDLDWR